MSPKLPLLTLIGNIGSGKSTALPPLLDALAAKPLYADDLFQTTDPFAKPYLDDTPRWAFTNELWLTHQRAQLLQDHVGTSGKSGQLTIVDSGLLMSWVYTYSHLLVKNITLDEWEFYQTLYDEFSANILQDTAVIRLKYSMETLLERIHKRGRDYELEYYTREYLEQIEQGLEALEKKLVMNGVPLLTIDESEIADFENSAQDQEKLIDVAKSFVFSSS